MCEVVAASRYGDVELARKVGHGGVALAIVGDHVADVFAQLPRVHHLERVDARDGAADHVANVVHATVAFPIFFFPAVFVFFVSCFLLVRSQNVFRFRRDFFFFFGWCP